MTNSSSSESGVTGRRSFDLRLYLVAGRADTRGRDLLDVVLAAVRGGVTMVQLREKDAPHDEIIALARALKDGLVPLGVPLIINDHPEVVRAADADGLHLGHDDMPGDQARALIGPDKILGLSAGDLEEARQVDPAITDYVGIGPAYETGTKADAGAAIGPEGISRLRSLFELPVVGVGGINAGNAAPILDCGVEGIAVVSAICAAADPEAAARDLRRIVNAAISAS